MTTPSNELQTLFRDSLMCFQEMVSEFSKEALELERLVLNSCHRGSADTSGLFASPQSTMVREEAWRVKFLLLDLIYGEPTTLLGRTSGDLTSAKGSLHFAWTWAQRLRSDEEARQFSPHIARAVGRDVMSYYADVLQPRYRACLRLWTSLDPADMALLSDGVKSVVIGIIDQLHRIDAAFHEVVQSCQMMYSALSPQSREYR
ncbi:hypothetical protein SSP24_82000 [Streptomyces spinoverrucosus]|uniref:Uncharacterized protein n=1 Tax=Streptomyces spinoverrucosus TaxID=284043 RepID=A0A4Y3VWP9_9ACTN|nr:hypothetical protein [Streptomyces spinoverrucosus]GEC10545.1 hypothetical protein SSP24_82000 [Streptomyces spinoverrucosus]GHB98819.1 hypothetical protein GCM10010397_83960 [Streptomyces spinoverrucosus]